ncbi:MAG: hypothetical protein PHS14_09580 [Elusimicrobia bacterium]|nr:hypothetical protein [Elusimicrobiota bacterium]
MIKTLILSSCVTLAAVAGARAADEAAKAAPDRATMVERHEQMAEMHKKAAECLKAGKPVKECHDAMMKDGPAKPGDCAFMGDGCPMCGPGKGMRGGMRGKGMRMGRPGAPADAPKKDEKKD